LGISSAASEEFSNIGASLIDLDDKDAALVRKSGALLLVRANILFHAAPEGSEITFDPALDTPWHVAWAQNAGLTSGITPAQWNTLLVAILDSGLNDHPDFSGAPIRWDLAYNAITRTAGSRSALADENGHGTNVAGTLAGSATGIVPSAPLLPVKVADKNGNAQLSDLIAAVDYLVGLAQNALAGKKIFLNFSYATDPSESPDNTLQRFFEELFLRCDEVGMLFFSAAGNEAADLDHKYVYPARASARNALAVAATDTAGLLAFFSNHSAYAVEVAAPGVAITTTDKSGSGYKTVNGTSFASPIATGVAAALWARRGELANWQVRNVLLNAVDTPLWMQRGSSTLSTTALPVIAGGVLRPARTTDTSFVTNAKGTEPKAVGLVPPSEGGGGGCVTATAPSGLFFLFIPLVPLFRRARR
jgi:subtilisin family serine protease